MDSEKKKRPILKWILRGVVAYVAGVAFFAIKIGFGQMNAKMDLVAVGRGQEAVKIIPEISFWDAAGAPFGWLFGDVIGGGLAWFFGDFLSLDDISFETWIIIILIIVIIVMAVVNWHKKKQPTL